MRAQRKAPGRRFRRLGSGGARHGGSFSGKGSVLGSVLTIDYFRNRLACDCLDNCGRIVKYQGAICHVTIRFPRVAATKMADSLVTERFYRVEVGGFVSRVTAENDADQRTDHETDDCPIDGERRW